MKKVLSLVLVLVLVFGTVTSSFAADKQENSKIITNNSNFRIVETQLSTGEIIIFKYNKLTKNLNITTEVNFKKKSTLKDFNKNIKIDLNDGVNPYKEDFSIKSGSFYSTESNDFAGIKYTKIIGRTSTNKNDLYYKLIHSDDGSEIQTPELNNYDVHNQYRAERIKSKCEVFAGHVDNGRDIEDGIIFSFLSAGLAQNDAQEAIVGIATNITTQELSDFDMASAIIGFLKATVGLVFSVSDFMLYTININNTKTVYYQIKDEIKFWPSYIEIIFI